MPSPSSPNVILIVAEDGRAISCTATSGDRSIDFVLVLTDEAGEWVLRP